MGASTDGVLTRNCSTYCFVRERSWRRLMNPPMLNRLSTASEVFSRQFIVSTSPRRLRSSGKNPIPARKAFVTDPLASSCPRRKILPVAAGSSPKSAWATSLRPAPTNPAKPRISPRRRAKLTPVNLPGEDRFSTRSNSSPGSRCKCCEVYCLSSRPTIC